MAGKKLLEYKSNTEPTPPPPPFEYYFDLFPTPSIGAYSFRKLRSDYTGACIRVRKTSGEETDIGFVNNYLDSASALSFLGNTGTITVWYDQYGTNNLVQTNTTIQPIIVSGGAVERTTGGLNSFVCFNTAGGIYWLNFTTRLTNIRCLFISWVYAGGAISNKSFILGDSIAYDYHAGEAGRWLNSSLAANYVVNGANRINGNTVDFANTVRTNSQNIILTSMIHTAPSGKSDQFTTDRTSGDRSWDNKVLECILYGQEVSANRDNIETNIMDYYEL